MEKIIASNRKAFHDYFILDQLEAGIVLTGTEIKAIRQGKVDIKQAYVQIKNNECWVVGMNIGLFDLANRFNHEPLRTRKLLLHRREISRLSKEVQLQGVTLMPLKVYFKSGRAKVEIAVAKGKKNYDKREALKERDIKRELEKKYNLK